MVPPRDKPPNHEQVVRFAHDSGRATEQFLMAVPAAFPDRDVNSRRPPLEHVVETDHTRVVEYVERDRRRRAEHLGKRGKHGVRAELDERILPKPRVSDDALVEAFDARCVGRVDERQRAVAADALGGAASRCRCRRRHQRRRRGRRYRRRRQPVTVWQRSRIHPRRVCRHHFSTLYPLPRRHRAQIAPVCEPQPQRVRRQRAPRDVVDVDDERPRGG